MDILTEVVTKYWVLGVSLITLVGIYKFALVASQKGLIGALSQILAFGAVVAVLVLLAGPFLNWTFTTIVGHVGQNTAVNSVLALTTQTIDLVKNAEVSSEPVLSLDVSQEEFNAAASEVKDKVQNTANKVTGNAAANSSSNAANNAAPVVAKPTAAPTMSAQQALNAVHNIAQPQPTATVPGGGQKYIDEFLKQQQQAQSSNSAQDALNAVKALDGGGGPNKTYTVKRGDYLAKIAKALGVDAKQLCAINSIRNCSVIHVNQVLVIP
ncbi:MAG: LysM domain-containing protein [Chryseobacterium sp.]|nr:MAG: LysM domain-containing protein [Chryseobacterium sp.]